MSHAGNTGIERHVGIGIEVRVGIGMEIAVRVRGDSDGWGAGQEFLFSFFARTLCCEP